MESELQADILKYFVGLRKRVMEKMRSDVGTAP